MGAGKTGNGGKSKRSMQLSESSGKEPKECVMERQDKSCSKEKEGSLEGDVGS